MYELSETQDRQGPSHPSLNGREGCMVVLNLMLLGLSAEARWTIRTKPLYFGPDPLVSLGSLLAVMVAVSPWHFPVTAGFPSLGGRGRTIPPSSRWSPPSTVPALDWRSYRGEHPALSR